jgi:hypothetical protein
MFCPRCRKPRPGSDRLCAECGETVLRQGFCPICEDYWRLAEGCDCPKHEIPLEPGPAAELAAEPFERLVTVGRFAHAAQAQAARIRLEAEGIPTFLQGERMGSAAMYAVATGGVAIQVPAELAADARIILQQSWSSPVEDDDLDDAWEDLAPEPGARRRTVMKGLILVFLLGPAALVLLRVLLGAG